MLGYTQPTIRYSGADLKAVVDIAVEHQLQEAIKEAFPNR